MKPARWLLAVMFTVLGAGHVTAQEDPAVEQASFRVLDGFEVNLYASERERVRKPIQIRFDPDGRLWVVGSVVYPQIKPGEEPQDEVVVLEDRDHDGRADRYTVFAGGLQIPTGIELGDGGVYVGAATELLHLRDTNGDGKADERRVVLRGFGTGDTHQTINSFCWGPGGELMMSQGLHAESRIETPWGVEELKQAGVWRYWPRQVRLDAFWTGAMGAHNPFGTVFDRWGQPLIFAGNGHGIYHLTQAMIRTDHFLEQRWLWNQGRKFGGADFVENSHWPEALQGEVVSGGYLQNTVERFRVTDDGATFKVDRLPPIIESTNTAFRIVDARFGPDGALYLCDWYNPVIGHYQASFRDPARDKVHGRIWRVTAKGRPLVKWSPMGALPAAELASQLGSSQRWQRQMARRVLAGRSADETTAALTRVTGALTGTDDTSALVRFEVLGAWLESGRVNTNLLVEVSRLPQSGARAFAARVAGEWARRREPGAIDLALSLLERLVADDSPRVRLEAVVACSYVPDPRAVQVAAAVVDHPMEPALEYAFTQCVAALRPWWGPLQASGELRFNNQPARAAAFAKAEGGTGSAQYAAGRLRRVAEVALEAEAIRQLSAVVATAGGAGDLPALVSTRSFTVGTNHLAVLQAQRLREAAESSRQRGVLPSGDLAAGLGKLLEDPNAELRSSALRAAGFWHVEALRSRVEGVAQLSSAAASDRIAAVDGVAGYGDEAAIRKLAVWSGPDQAPEVRSAAIGAWVALQPVEAARAAAVWFQTGAEADSVSRIMTAFIRQRNGLAALATALQAQAPASGTARLLQEQLARSGQNPPELATVLKSAVQGASLARSWSAADIPSLAAGAKSRGNRSRGAVLFQSPQLACTTCHSVDGTPGRIGPELGALGTAQTVEFIVGAIVEPQKEVKEGFMAYEITSRDGTVRQGYLRGETDDTVTLQDHLSGQTVRIPRNQIDEQRQLGTLMPAGLVDALTAEELQDLVAYLAGLGRR